MKIMTKTIGPLGKPKAVPRACNQCGKLLHKSGTIELCQKCLKKQ